MAMSSINTTQTLLPALSILLLLSSSYFVIQHAKRQTSCVVILLSILSFGFGFAAVALLPIDLSYASVALMNASAGNDNENFNDDEVHDDGIENNPTYLPWRITYWTTFLLAWFILPITREVLTSGQFTFYHRLKDGISNSFRGLLIMMICGITSMIAMAIHMKSFHLVTIVLPVLMALGNTYGLLLVALLLGNGLVNIPKRYWREACPAKELRRALIMTTNAEEELFGAVMELEDVEDKIEVVCQTAVCLKDDDDNGMLGGSSTEEGGGRHQRRRRRGFCTCQVDEVTAFHECLEELVRRKNETADLCSERRTRRGGDGSGGGISPRRRSSGGCGDNGDDGRNSDGEVNTMDIKYLVSLSGLLTTAQERVTSAQLRWDYLIEHSRLLSKLMDDDTPSTNIRGEFESESISDILLTSSSVPNRCCRNLRFSLQRTWVRYLRYPVYRCIAIITATLSVFVLLSEVTLGVPLNLSPFSWTLHALDRYHKEHNNSTSRFLFQVTALIPLLYMSLCVYTCLAQISQLGPFCLRSNRQSTGVALIFNAQYLVRLQFSLGYNYLLM
jgi:hypothetical protein